ncbi:nucleoid-associated protein [Myroides odoratus]|uniref:Nucleoid-associated protein YejK n=1 Tax=Myroides odoratus TaxID=256 RepID=A0A378RI35_MYROD|nr:nucleoid-associated protein [Myroides odoratus]QQU02365.1 nucleoid-associated protein [Myroides odoratus]STZ26696.1 Nucleoid-associated protein YejK [Myroides odoratus]
MIIKKIVFHQIIKESDSLDVTLNLSEDIIRIDEDVEVFVERLIKSFNQKYPTQGIFEDNTDLYPFQKYFANCLNEEFDFIDFTHRSMSILENKISVPNATGGYVVFLLYENLQQDFLITIMLDKSEQFTVNDLNLGIEKLKTLDLDKIARGSRLNITKWKDESNLYLSFIKGTRTLSNYFIQFIGATDITSSKENIRKLYENVNNYLLSTSYTQNKKERLKEKISDYLTNRFEKKELVELQAISGILFPEDPNNFIEYLHLNNSDVSDYISITRASDYKIFKGSVVKGNGFELFYDRKLLKEGKIIAKNGRITIVGVTDELIKQINNGY